MAEQKKEPVAKAERELEKGVLPEIGALARGPVRVELDRAPLRLNSAAALEVVIQRSTEALSFDRYVKCMEVVLCGVDAKDDCQAKHTQAEFTDRLRRRFLPYTNSDAYRLLKVATEAFVEANCGRFIEGLTDHTEIVDVEGLPRFNLSEAWQQYLVSVNGTNDMMLPYLAIIRKKLKDYDLIDHVFPDPNTGAAWRNQSHNCDGIERRKLTAPCLLELIWSYWHEQGMLVQTMNAISRRFQNVRGADRDPLAGQEIDYLRPLGPMLWVYIQDEQHRLTVVRRAYEYEHQYGLRLQGRAVPELRAADRRTKFLQAFHQLLYSCCVFFKQDDDTTVKADGFPVLNALKEVHFLLAEGAHNQFGDLTSTARIEMLMQQWLLARPEFREFLPTRVMVAYPEPWMDRVDAMKNLQGWPDTSVLHFHSLGKFGEQLLLSARFGAWGIVNDANQAAVWARFWRSQIQGYVHAYRSVTGVDLASDRVEPQMAALRAAQPSALLSQRLAARRQPR